MCLNVLDVFEAMDSDAQDAPKNTASEYPSSQSLGSKPMNLKDIHSIGFRAPTPLIRQGDLSMYLLTALTLEISPPN